jgi:hypothetical protein
MSRTWTIIGCGAALGLAVGVAPMVAQTLGALQPAAAPAEQAAARPQRPTPDCSRDRAWLEAEQGTPGILQSLAREAVEFCEAQQAAVAAAVRMAAER